MITFKAKTNTGEIINSALSPFSFPAGEAHIKREEHRELEPTEIAILQFTPESLHTDMFQLMMWSNYVYNISKDIRQVAVIPYFPGARADRGIPFGAGEYAQFVYGTAVDEVVIFDPHSQVIVEELNYDPEFFKVTTVYPAEFFSDATVKDQISVDTYEGIIAPDKGAVGRSGSVAEALGLPLYTAEKTRNFETGKLTGFAIEESFPSTGRYLIVDDICDGGGTFIGLAEAVKEKYPEVEIDLYVSHGVFSSKALELLPQMFGNVFTTNSYSPSRDLPDSFKRFDSIRLLLAKIN